MNIKLDENMPYRLVDILAQLGHQVDTIPQEGIAGQELWLIQNKYQKDYSIPCHSSCHRFRFNPPLVKTAGFFIALLLMAIYPLYAKQNDIASSHIHFLTTGPKEGGDVYLSVAILKYDEIYALRIDEIKRDILNNKNEKRVASYFLEGNTLMSGAIHELQFVKWLSWNEFEIQASSYHRRIQYEAGKGFRQYDDVYSIKPGYIPLPIPKLQYEHTKEQFIDEMGARVVAACEGEGCRSEGRYVAIKAVPVYSSPNTASKIVSRLIPGELLMGKEQVHAITGIGKIIGKPPKYNKHGKDIPDLDFAKPFEILYDQGEGWTMVKQGNHFYSIDMMPDECRSGQEYCLEEIRKHKSWVWVFVTGRDRKIKGWVLHKGEPILSIESCSLC